MQSQNSIVEKSKIDEESNLHKVTMLKKLESELDQIVE